MIAKTRKSFELLVLCSALVAPTALAQPAEEPTEAPETAPAEPTPAAELPPPAPTPAPAPEPAAPEPELPGFQAGDFRLIPQLEFRGRSEIRGNQYTPAGSTHNTSHTLFTRVRAGLDARWGNARAVVQFQDNRTFGTTPGQDDGGTFALHQGFAELGNELGYMRLGRQEINLGDQRLIGALDWLMGARSFDGLRLHGNFGDVNMDLFGAILGRGGSVTDAMGNTARSRGDYLGIAHMTWVPGTAFGLDAYTLYRRNDATAAALGRDDHIVAPGLRAFGQLGFGLKYSLEGTVQFGERAGQSHLAYGVAGDAWQGMMDGHMTLRGGFSVGSGAGGNLDELENFFPTNHKFYGFIDYFGWRNVIEGHVGLDVMPTADLKLSLTAFTFALNSDTGRWSNAGGATLGVDGNGGARSLGQELDLVMLYKISAGVKMVGGYSFFAPNDGARRLGQEGVSHWGWLMLVMATP